MSNPAANTNLPDQELPNAPEGLIPVNNSSNVEYIGYSAGKQLLTVQFKGGKQYAYAEVPLDVFLSMQQSDSIGKFIHSSIKGKFTCSVV